MPEYPDIVVYLEALERRVLGAVLLGVRIRSPFLLRTVTPPLADAAGRKVVALRRSGKRIVFELEGGLFLAVHLMVAGRFQWKDAGAGIPGRRGLAAFDFETGTLLLTEAGTRKRASLHVFDGEDALATVDRGGLELFEASREEFRERLRLRNHTLKRALVDPTLFSGVGNAYSDEILLRARLSPFQWTSRLDDGAVDRLFEVAKAVLEEWTEILRAEVGEGFPKKVTAFRPEMAAHGKWKEPCPQCGTPIQRIVYAENECNYCPDCQTGGKLLADRALSQLLKKDWPKTVAELEERLSQRA